LAIDIAEPMPDGAVVEEVDVTEPVEVIEELEAMEPVALGVEPELLNGPGSATEAHGVDVVAVVETIGDQINAQSDRIETQSSEVRRLVQHMEQLPLVLKQTAEIRGQCAQVIELVGGQVSEARTREETVVEAVSETRRHEDAVMEAINEARGHNDAVMEAIQAASSRDDAVMEAIRQASSRDDAVIEAVNAAVEKAVSASVKRITEASARDAETLSRIQEQVESNAQALRMAGETEEGASQNMREVLESSMKVERAVTGFEKSHQGREAEIATHFASSKRTMMMLAFACTLASLLALVVALIAVVT
jgi:chromosome segregation ATPase